jgi:protein SCO1
MRISALIFALIACVSCSKPSWHMTDISGGMPKLKFHMTSGGKLVTAEDFRGKVVALYFGFTHCPDVCPATLANLTDMLAKVNHPDLRILFVTVDPDRDTDVVMSDYAAAFSPQMVGLRGGRNELANLARTWRIAYSVEKGPPYEVNHSNAVYFFDREGMTRLVTTDTSNTSADRSESFARGTGSRWSPPTDRWGQMCSAALSAASTASCIISESVGCGKMVCDSSASVSSPDLATT